MKRLSLVFSMLFALTFFLITPLTTFAEDSNQGEVRAGLEEGGWNVVYDDQIVTIQHGVAMDDRQREQRAA